MKNNEAIKNLRVAALLIVLAPVLLLYVPARLLCEALGKTVDFLITFSGARQ